MRQNTNPAKPSLPNGMVTVDKGARGEVYVAVVGPNRVPMFGFDTKSLFPPYHWRPIPYGPFGLFVAAKQGVEVKAILDGKVITEQKLFPSERPTGVGISPELLKLMSETPQPHVIMTDTEGKQFMFAAPEGDRTDAELVAQQMHPGSFGTPPSLSDVDTNATMRDELKMDIDPSTLNVPWLTRPAAPTDTAVAAATTSGDEQLATAETSAPSPEAELAEMLGPEATAALAAVTSEAPVLEDTDERAAPALDVMDRPLTWAPSHGLLAIGVRLLQAAAPNEPPTAPDGFTYVLFQLNPMARHALAMNRQLNRVIIPSKETLRDLMVKEGFEADAPSVPRVVCNEPNCKHVHGHSHRRR
jgi:hypothetical protein